MNEEARYVKIVEWSEQDNRFSASGPVEYVFMGTYYYEEAEEDED